MDVLTTHAEFLDVNCYAVRAEGRSDCILIDAGYDCAPRLESLRARWNVPVHLGGPDRYRLQDPASTLSPQFAPMLAPLVEGWTAPEVSDLADGQSLETAGLTVTAVSAPGHTEGSMLLRV